MKVYQAAVAVQSTTFSSDLAVTQDAVTISRILNGECFWFFSGLLFFRTMINQEKVSSNPKSPID